MKLSFTLFAFFLCFALNAQYVGFNKSEIKQLKLLIKKDAEVNQYYQSFLTTANKALEEAPNPIDTIRSEGLLKGNPRKTATQKALEDMPKMYALSLMYKISGDKKYLTKATTYLKAWASYTKSNGDPIDETNLDRAIEAYDMIKGDMSSADAQLVREWFRQAGNMEITAIYNDPKRMTAINNWNSHRLKVIGQIAWTINDEKLKNYTIEGLKKQLVQNLLPSGSSIDFEERDALHYHVYDLEPLLKLCIVLQRATKTDYYSFQSSANTSIKKSVEWLIPYLTGEKTHGEYTNSKVEFDRKRAENKEPGFQIGKLFEPKAGVDVLVLASYFNQPYLETARKVLDTQAQYPIWYAVVNAVMKK